MKYTSIQASPRFRPYLKAIWMLESKQEEEGHRYRFTPDGYAELCFHIKDPWDYSVNGEKETFNLKTKMVGQYSRSLDVILPSSIKTIYIKFYPWAFYAVFGIPLHIFTNNHIQFDDVFKDAAAYLAEQFSTCDTLEQVRQIIEPWLLKKLQKAQSYDKDCVKIIKVISEDDGVVKSDQLIAQYTRSKRRLQQQFKTLVGLSPKQFANVKRVHKATQLVKSNIPLMEITHLLGYYDQAHFIHDFKYFTGLTPRNYCQKISPEGKFNSFSTL